MTDLVTVSEAIARRAVFDYASTKAEAWTEELERFGKLWRKFNEDFFDGELDEPHIAIGSPTSPKAWGEFHKIGGDGLRSLIMIRRTHVDGTFNRGKVPLPGQTVRFFQENHDVVYRCRHLADILLHEQVHQWQHQHGNPSRTKHDVEFAANATKFQTRSVWITSSAGVARATGSAANCRLVAVQRSPRGLLRESVGYDLRARAARGLARPDPCSVGGQDRGE